MFRPPAPSHCIVLVMQPLLSLPCQEDALGKSLREIMEHVSLEHPYSLGGVITHLCTHEEFWYLV